MSEEKRPFIAHWRIARENEKLYAKNENREQVSVEVQTIVDHLRNTSELAAKFASDFCAEEYARQIGLAHDIGKYSDAFQKRIWEQAAKTDHATAGAKEVWAINGRKFAGVAAAYCIAGHHTGLLNGGSSVDISDTANSLYGRFNKKLADDYLRYKADLELSVLPSHPKVDLLTTSKCDTGLFSIAFWIRILFSCLVDADYLDTELFMQYDNSARYAGESLIQLKRKLDAYIASRSWLNHTNGINGFRSGILKNCIEKGKSESSGIFSLTVPTGGGKTVASMAFAMNHAVTLEKRRIIYVIPYCSIIDQTVDVFSDIFGKENVLAHYSAAEPKEGENETEVSAKLLATENWDRPIIVTTAVQFFESLFANKTSKCRKLHNIVNSVIIFDEAQTLPLHYLKPCLAAVMELVVNYHCTSVFCTATQPSLNMFIEKYFVNREEQNFPIREICDDPIGLYEAFKRVTYEKIGKLSDEELAGRLSEYDQVLCIVSTKKQACNVYHLLQGEGNYHLSKCMTSIHIRQTLEEIKACLKTGKKCRVVATNLVEAGIDLDFPVVFRAKAGLDSVIQAGGRCNREGKRPVSESKVFIFEPEEQYTSSLPESIRRQISIMDIVTDKVADIAHISVVNRYFNNLYHNLNDSGAGTSDELDAQQIIQSFEESKDCSFPFADVARKFRIIESNMVLVLIPRDEDSELLAQKLQEKEGHISASEYREIGKYCVSIYQDNLKKISGSVVMVDGNLGILAIPSMYDKHTGLKMEEEGGLGIIS